MRRPLAALVSALLLLGLAPAGIALPGGGRALAAEYTLPTEASYAIHPDQQMVAVKVTATFTNTTPDPAGQFSVFERVDLAIHSGATKVAAEDASGALSVAVATRAGVNVASVRPREPIRYNESATFELTYELPDGASPDVRVRSSAIVFPIWAFGTSSQVAVTLPVEYEVRVDGDELAAEQDGAVVRLDSGAVDDPSRWLARITAVSATSYTTHSEAVALGSGTVDLQVQAWADDEAWGEATLALLVEALPALEERIGLDYPRVGPLVVVESVPDLVGDLSEPTTDAGEMAVAFDAAEFTILHQAAHVWLSEQLVGDRWIREGFASLAAAAVAAEREIALPYDPEERAGELDEAAFPLISWGAGASTAAQDAWAYASSWALAARLASAVGEDGLRLAWRRMAAGVGAYEPVGGEAPVPSGLPVAPVDSRRLLDQLEAVNAGDMAAEFIASAFDATASAELSARASAREAYAGLLAVAGDWGSPDPVRAQLAGWRFDEAEASIAEAIAWLADRDELLVAIEAAGLTMPERLRHRYRTAGGGTDARAELDAQTAVVRGYVAVRELLAQDLSIVKRVGLLGGTAPSDMLDDAALLFGSGDLRGAADAVDAARARVDGAAADGLVRIVSAAAVAALLLALAVLVARRRRSRGYTAAP